MVFNNNTSSATIDLGPRVTRVTVEGEDSRFDGGMTGKIGEENQKKKRTDLKMVSASQEKHRPLSLSYSCLCLILVLILS